MFYCERCGDPRGELCCERLDLPTEPVLCDACYEKAKREKLIDVFMHIGDHITNRDEYGICFDTPLAKAIEDVLAMLKKQDANGVTVQKWIPVTERLPEIVSTHKRYRSTIKKSVRVLCVCVQKSGKTMVKEGYCEWYNDYPEPRWQIPGTIDEVTHWQYLPQPPKGE